MTTGGQPFTAGRRSHSFTHAQAPAAATHAQLCESFNGPNGLLVGNTTDALDAEATLACMAVSAGDIVTCMFAWVLEVMPRVRAVQIAWLLRGHTCACTHARSHRRRALAGCAPTAT